MQSNSEPSLLLEEARRLKKKLTDLGRLNSLRDPIAGMVEAMGLTSPQMHAVLWLGEDGPHTMGELARLIGITDKTVTGIADRLERDGYARRVRDESDRRVIKVELTEKGREAYQRLDETILRKTAEFLGILAPDEHQVLHRIIDRMTALAARTSQTSPDTEKPIP